MCSKVFQKYFCKAMHTIDIKKALISQWFYTIIYLVLIPITLYIIYNFGASIKTTIK